MDVLWRMAVLFFSNALHLNMSKKGANGNLEGEKVGGK